MSFATVPLRVFTWTKPALPCGAGRNSSQNSRQVRAAACVRAASLQCRRSNRICNGQRARRQVHCAASAAGAEYSATEDHELVNEILACGTWSAVQEKVRKLAIEGRLTPSVFTAAAGILEECQTRGLDENITRTMESVCNLLATTLQQLNMPPAMRLVGELTQLDPADPSQASQITKMITDAVGAGKVQLAEVVEDLEYFLNTLAEQEGEFNNSIKHVADSGTKEEFDQVLQIVEARRAAQTRMTTILGMVKAM